MLRQTAVCNKRHGNRVAVHFQRRVCETHCLFQALARVTHPTNVKGSPLPTADARDRRIVNPAYNGGL